MDLLGYFGLFPVECHETRTNDYSQNTVNGSQLNNLICIFICWPKLDLALTCKCWAVWQTKDSPKELIYLVKIVPFTFLQTQ